MRAVDFMINRAAMCKYYGGIASGCKNGGEMCPLHEIDCDISSDMSVQDAERMQAIVEKWADHNKDTNEERFKKMFGIDLMDFWTMCNVNAEEWAKQRYEE